MRNGAPFDQGNTRVTLSDPTMPVFFSTGGGNIYFVSRNLILDNTMDADSGTYTCVASNRNAVDPIDMQNFTLFVRGEGYPLFVNACSPGLDKFVLMCLPFSCSHHS